MQTEITIPVAEYLRLNRENGYAKGLLSGWLQMGSNPHSVEATKAFLETKDA